VWQKGSQTIPRYIQKRRQRWYALLDIPSDVRASFDGKPRFVESLKTKNEARAVILASPKIALRKLQISKARDRPATLMKPPSGHGKLTPGNKRTTSHCRMQSWPAPGYTAAKLLAATAFGQKTLLEPLTEQWLAESGYGARATYDHRGGE